MQQLYELTEHLSILLGRELCGLTFDTGDTQQRFVTALYASTLELAGDSLILAQQTRYSGLPILCRSALEALVHMRALIKHPDYYNRMLANVHHEEARMCKNALELNQAMITANLGLVNDLRRRYENAISRRDALEKKGHLRVDIKGSFVLADLSDRYSPVYSTLCSHSHNNLNVVAERHYEERGDTYIPVFEREWSDSEIKKYIVNLADILIDAHSAFSIFFNILETDEIKSTIASIIAAVRDERTHNHEPEATGAPPATGHP